MQFHKHRIVPGHIGGQYDKQNVIRVNVAMHAFLHEHLWKLYGHVEDWLAYRGLLGLTGKDEIVAEIHRLSGPKISAALTGRKKSAESRAKMSLIRKGKHLSDVHRQNVIRALTGRPCSESTRQKIRAAHEGKPTGRTPWNKGKSGYSVTRVRGKGWKQNAQWKAQMSERMRGNSHASGQTHSDEWKAQAAARMSGRQHSLGYRHSIEAKAKIAAAQNGVKHSAEHHAKIWAARRKKQSENTLLTGKV